MRSDSPGAGAQIGLHPSRRGCLRKPLAVLWIEVRGDGFIRSLQGYYCPNKHLLCQTWSTAAAQRPLNFIWISISPSFLPFEPHCFQTWIAYCTGLLHFFHLNGLHQALAPDFLPTTLVPTSSGLRKLSHILGFCFFPVAGGQDAPPAFAIVAACHSRPDRGHLGTTNPRADTHLFACVTDRQTAWTEQEAAEPNFPRKLLNPYHFPLSYTHARLTDRPPSHKAQQEKVFLQHFYNINQKTWTETLSPKDHFWAVSRAELQKENSGNKHF